MPSKKKGGAVKYGSRPGQTVKPKKVKPQSAV
jgi:hypothetical protein